MTTPSDHVPQPPPAPPSYWDAPREEAGPAPGVRFASHGVRLVSYIIDGLIVGIIYVVIAVAASFALGGALVAGAGNLEDGVLSGPAAVAVGLFSLVLVAVFFLVFAYFPFFWVRNGQTPGMRPFGLYVVRDSDGGRISSGQAILRMVGMWVSAIPLYLGFIWVFIDARHRGWHDLIAGTVVVERMRD